MLTHPHLQISPMYLYCSLFRSTIWICTELLLVHKTHGLFYIYTTQKYCIYWSFFISWNLCLKSNNTPSHAHTPSLKTRSCAITTAASQQWQKFFKEPRYPCGNQFSLLVGPFPPFFWHHIWDETVRTWPQEMKEQLTADPHSTAGFTDEDRTDKYILFWELYELFNVLISDERPILFLKAAFCLLSCCLVITPQNYV